MKIKLYILLIFTGLLFYECSSEPEEKVPTALELLVGAYQTPWLQIDQGNGLITIEINDSSSLEINSDNTYTLFIKATVPNSDSVIIIQQNGMFDIRKSKYDKYVDQTIPIETLNGEIMFYPKDKNPWGGVFSFSFEIFNIEGNIKIENVDFSYFQWFKLTE